VKLYYKIGANEGFAQSHFSSKVITSGGMDISVYRDF